MLPRTISALALFLTVNAGLALLPPQPADKLDEKAVVLTEKVLSEGKPSSWWLARTYLTNPLPAVVVCGSSQIGGLQAADANTTGKVIDFVADHHCPTLENALAARVGGSPYVFLSALPGAMISDHFAIARALYSQAAPPVVVVTVSPRDFIDNTLPCAGSTEPYRFFSRYSKMDKYTNLAYNEPWARFSYAVSNELPVRKLLPPLQAVLASLAPEPEPDPESESAAPSSSSSSSSQLSAPSANAGEQLKFVMGGYEGNLKPGQAVVEPNMPRIFVDNTRDYRRRYKNTHPAAYDVQMSFFGDFLNYLKERGVKVLVVGMPLTACNRDILPPAFWQDFRGKVNSVCQANQAEYLDLSASPDFGRDDFCDTVHLNAWGGTKLAEHIAAAISERQTLREALLPTSAPVRQTAQKAASTL